MQWIYFFSKQNIFQSNRLLNGQNETFLVIFKSCEPWWFCHHDQTVQKQQSYGRAKKTYHQKGICNLHLNEPLTPFSDSCPSY